MTVEYAESASAWSHGLGVDLREEEVRSHLTVASSSQGIWQANLRPMFKRPANWLPEVAARVRYLLTEVGASISHEAVNALGFLLEDPIFEGTPMPMLSPAGEGGIAAEFRRESVELQIEIDAGGQVSVYAYQRGGVEWEGPIDNLPDGIEKWAWRLGHGSPLIPVDG